MTQFQENAQTDRRMDGQKDPSGYPWGVHKYLFLPKWVAKKIATGRLKKIILSYFNPSLTLKKLFFSLIVYTTKG